MDEKTGVNVSMDLASNSVFTAGSASIPPKPTASLSRKKSHEYSGAFSGFKVETSKDLGRYATTTVDLAAGETIVVEEPHASVLNFDKYGGYCHHCQERLVAVFSCPWCRGLGFCSQQCGEIAVSSYHVYECHLTDLIYASGMSHLSALALRVVSQKDLEYFKAFTENEEKLDGSVRSYASIRNLVGHEELRDGKDMFMRTMMAVFQLRLLKFSGYFKVKQDAPAEYPEEIAGVPDLGEDELLIGTVLLRNLHVLQFNAHEVCDLAVVDGQGLMKAKSHSVGLAVYQTASLFNHSCYPNVARYFIGTKLVICTTRQVPSGAALYDNYGPLFTQKNLVQRKKLTQGRYWFDCSCEACTQDWPVLSKMTIDENQRFRCTKCGNLLSKNKSEKTTKCSRCQSENDLITKQTAVQEATKLIKDAAGKMDRRDNAEAIESLLEAIKLMESNIVPPFRDLHLAQDYLRLCYSATGSNWKTTAPKK